MSAPPRGLTPACRRAGPLRVPGSKSVAQRAVVMAALADGPTRLTGLPESDDVRAALAAVQALGTTVAQAGGRTCTVDGRIPGPDAGWGGPGEPCAQAGESGTAARLVTAAAGLCARAGASVVVDAAGSLLSRGSPALLAALEEAGVGVEPLGPRPDGWPVRLVPVGPPSEVRLVRPTSSQEVSGLLIALAAWPDEIRLLVEGSIPSAPYVDLTCRLLEHFGVVVVEEPGPGRTTFHVPGPLESPLDPFLVEPDASAAAVALAAGCLSGGGVQVRGLTLTSPQGDVRVIEHLRALGIEAGEERGALFATGRPTSGAVLDLSGEPDLAPPLAAVAAAAALAGHRTHLGGLGTLPGKESSRIEVLAQGLAAVGLRVEAGDDYLTVGPGSLTPGPLVLEPRGDHRMAFAFALLGLLRGEVRVGDPGCVAKSWPTFWEDLEAAGAEVV